MALVIGTAGHIDHGKTSLVKALTGVDCDRLEEEKKRGITIELGFAALRIGNTLIGVVDVPGHEKFVKNMVAGASGIDVLLLVVAADEGIMPQTREHVEICNLLGIKHGLVALTKIDSVESDMLELAKEEVSEFLQNSCLANAPIFPVSALENKGLEELKDSIFELDKSLTKEYKTDLFRLSVDRVFTMKGHGTVITGTSIAGRALLQDEISIYPKNALTTRIRAIQSHGESIESIEAGRRISINLANCSVEDLSRGDVLARPDTLFPTDKWLVKLHCLDSAPQGIAHRKEVHFHHGARELAVRVYLFDRQVLEQGDTCFAEIRYTDTKGAKALVGVFNDHCVLRSSSPLRTIAGATLLMPLPYSFTRKDFTEDLQKTFLELEEFFYSDPEKLVLSHINLSKEEGRNFNELCVLTALHSKQLEKHLNALLGKGEILCYAKDIKAYITKTNYSLIEENFLKNLEEYHAKEPLKAGMLKNMFNHVLKHEIEQTREKLVSFVLERLQKNKKIVYINEVYALPHFEVKLAQDDKEIERKILHALRKDLQSPPNMKEILDEIGISIKEAQAILKLLTESKQITKLTENMYYDTQELKAIEERTYTYFQSNDSLDPAAFKEITNGLSRKYIIAMLEYFDRQKFTFRVNDVRKLRKTGNA